MPNPSKIHPKLARHLASERARAFGEPHLNIIVKYRSADALADTVSGLEASSHAYRFLAARAYGATAAAINALSERDDVEMVWFDEPVHTMLDVSVPLLEAPLVWQAGFTGKGIKVAIVDTGIDPNHPDFANRIAQMKDFTGEGPGDNNGHGTHVAGIVGGSGAASNGKYKGVAPDCMYFAVKVLRGNGSGSTSDVMAGIEWAVQQGAQVINLSLGSDGACDGSDALSTLCDAAVSRGVVMCIAAGNAGPDTSTVGSPGCAKTVITVGATNKSDRVADFSSRGPTSDNRIKPDICFPGVSIVACRAAGTSMGTPLNSLYTSASGTSMATPHATGACALLLEAKPGLAPQQIKDLLASTAKDLQVEPNTGGKGRAQVYLAYQGAVEVTPEPPQPPQPPTAPGNGCLPRLKSALTGR